MQSLSTKESFFIGLGLSNNSNNDSSICVLDRNSRIILIDKFYYAQDIEYFFETSPYTKNSVLCVSVAYDNRMLSGKWRIHAKNYKVLGEYFKVNKDDWTNRVSKRCVDIFKKIQERDIKVIRADINQLRLSYGISPHYLQGSSIDCKNLQMSLKIKYGFYELPDNMLSFSSLQSIICAMFAMDYANNIETKEIFKVDSIPVLSRAI